MDPKELGKLGEQMAAEFLAEKGFEIIDRNFVFDKAEIDIVALYQNTMVFVEVKTRESDFMTDISQLIGRSKQKQIIKAADGYMKQSALNFEGRFDIILIVTNSKYTKIEHIEDAFYPTI